MMKLILQAGNTFSITICLSIICIYSTPVGAQANTPCVELRFSTETAHTGDTVTIKLTTRGFSGITGYQFAVRWNSGDLQYLKHTAAGSALDFQLFNAAQNAQGKLLSVWSDVNATGVTLPDDAFLFEIKFKVLAAGPSYFPVFIDPDATPVYELIQYSTTLPLSHVAGGVRIGVSGDLQIASCCVSPPPCNAPLGSAALEVTGGTQPYQYLWEGTGGFTSVSAQPANFSPGSYKVTVTDAAGVQALAVITIPYVYSSVTVSAVDIKNAQCGQANGCISLLANGGVAPYVYQWSTPGSTENNRCDLLPGDHSVTVTDALGCIQSGTFPVGNDEHLSVKLDSINADCRFDQPGGVHSIVTGTAPYTYQWSNGATTADLDGLTPGLYSVTVLDAAGCKTSKAVTVKDYGTFDWFFGLAEKCPTATESGALKLSGYDFAYRAAFPITLIWSTGTVQEVNAVDDNVVWPVLSQLSDLPGNGRYSVTVVDAQGCSASNEAVMNCASYGSIEKFNTRFYIKGTSSGALDSCAVVVAQDFKNISELRFSLRWHPSW
ncbi:MAG: hypothetical protein KA165_12440, partial [Saprospiraceae bacterium]|nr:hypothetical protein [Saprospiraceae bacterium]